MAISKFLIVKEVSEMLLVSEGVVRRMINSGELKAKKVRRDWRIKESALQNYLKTDHEAKRASESNRLAKFANSLGSKTKGSLAMYGKKSKLPERLNLGHGGYYRREYPLTERQEKEEPSRLPMVRWAIWYYDADDKKHEKIIKLATSPEDCLLALEIERKKEFQKYLGNDVETEEKRSYTFQELADEYIENYNNPRSIVAIKSRINKHLIPYFGSRKLEEITFRSIKKLANDLVNKGMKGSAANTILKTLRAVLNEAKDYGWIENVIEIKKCFVPENDSEERKVIPNEDFKKIYDKAPNYLQKMMIIARLTALRGRELRTLKWDCVNFSKEEIVILPQFDKTKKGKKSVITPEIREILNELKRSRNGNELVFTFNDQPITRTRQANAFKNAMIEAGFKKGSYDFHELRHTAITMAAENGAGLQAVMDLAGHHDPTTTKRYMHHNWEQQKKAANSLTLNGKNGNK